MHRPDISITITTMDPDSGEQDDALTLAASFEGSVVIDVPPSQGDRVVLSFPLLSEEDQKPGDVMVAMDPLDLLGIFSGFLRLFEERLAWKSINRTKGLHGLVRDLVDMLEPMIDRCSLRDEVISIMEGEVGSEGLNTELSEALKEGWVALSPVVSRLPSGEMRVTDPIKSAVVTFRRGLSPESYLHQRAAEMRAPLTEREAFSLLTGTGQVQAHIVEMMGETAES